MPQLYLHTAFNILEELNLLSFCIACVYLCVSKFFLEPLVYHLMAAIFSPLSPPSSPDAVYHTVHVSLTFPPYLLPPTPAPPLTNKNLHSTDKRLLFGIYVINHKNNGI